MTATTTPKIITLDESKTGRYMVRCPECLETVRMTNSMMESAGGQLCAKCVKELRG